MDVNTVEPSLSDLDVRDLSRIRTEKQDSASANVRRDCKTETSPDRETSLSGAHSHHIWILGLEIQGSPHLRTYEVPKTCPCQSTARRCCTLRARGPVQRAPQAGRVRKDRWQWSTADIAGDDKDADSEGSSKDSTVSKTPHAAGRNGEQGHTQPTGSVPRHHVMSSVRDSICTLVHS